jgi:signal peptidase I
VIDPPRDLRPAGLGIADPGPSEPTVDDIPRDVAEAAMSLPDRSSLDSEAEEKPRKRSYPFWVEVPVLMVLALVIAVVIKTFLAQAFFIPSESMLDTLEVDDRILVNKLAFRFDEPSRGDVVVFDSGERRNESIAEAVRRNLAEALGLSAPESDFVKRVIGLPGERLEIRDNQVFINGAPIAQPYLKPGTAMGNFGPVTVEVDHYFMMGDNRNRSSDSRFAGTVHVDRFVGRAFVILWPPGNWGGL